MKCGNKLVAIYQFTKLKSMLSYEMFVILFILVSGCSTQSCVYVVLLDVNCIANVCVCVRSTSLQW